MKTARPILAAMIVSLALTGCASTTPPATPSAAVSVRTQTSSVTATATASGASPSASATFPAGQPPRPGRQDGYASSDSVPGLDAAVSAAEHPGLQICDGNVVTLITASGDLRGNGGEQYLVDTTCFHATASSPDEVSLYDVQGTAITRSAVLYETTANRPRSSSYPYLWQRHTVVIAYDEDARYRLIQLTPDSVTPGSVQNFH